MKYKVYDARKDAAAYLSDDGLALYVFESGGMMKKSKFTKLSADWFKFLWMTRIHRRVCVIHKKNKNFQSSLILTALLQHI